MTQQELADRSGLGVRSIRNIEAGHVRAPRLPTVRLLADAFGLTGVDREEFCESAVRPGSPNPPVPAVVPAQVPADVWSFVGRDAALARLDRLLIRTPDQPPAAAVVSALAGTAGVGKTALAVHWAHRVADHFPDGQLYVNMRGFDPAGPPMTPAEALRGFLDALGVPPERIPAELQAQIGLYRSTLAGKRVLLLIDNARDAEQVRPLLPNSPEAVAVVTSRDRLTGLVAVDGAQPITVDVMSPTESRQLLVGRLGVAAVDAAGAAAEHIIDACAGLPLALAIVSGRAQQSGMALSVLADDLRTETLRLDALDAGDPASEIRVVFSWSYRALDPATARLFRFLGVHPGPDISAAAAASLAAVEPNEIRPSLKALVQANLLAEASPGRYGSHDLVRIYASEQHAAVDPAAEREAAADRMFDHYLHTALVAAKLLYPTRDLDDCPPPRHGTFPEALTSDEQALAWFAAERRVLLRLVRQAATTHPDHAWRLAWAMTTFLDQAGHWHDWVAIGRLAVQAAHASVGSGAQARARRHLAIALLRLGQIDDALPQLEKSLHLSRRAGDLVGQAFSEHNLALAYEGREDHRSARVHIQRALDLYRDAGHETGQANALTNLAWYLGKSGQHAEAIVICQDALVLQEKIGNRQTQAATWDTLGYLHHQRLDIQQALECYQRALQLYAGHRYNEAEVLDHLGDAYTTANETEQARLAWHRAAAILDDLDPARAKQIRGKAGIG